MENTTTTKPQKRVFYGYAFKESDGWKTSASLPISKKQYWAVVIDVLEEGKPEVELLSTHEAPLTAFMLVPGQELRKDFTSLNPMFDAKIGEPKDQKRRLKNLYDIFKITPNPQVQVDEDILPLGPEMLVNIALEPKPKRKVPTKTEIEKLYAKAEEIIDR